LIKTIAGLNGIRVLIVSNQTHMGQGVQSALNRDGASITLSQTLSNARSTLGFNNTISNRQATLPYDVILIDLKLPDGSGGDLLQQLKEFDYLSHVLLTSDESTYQEALDATKMGVFAIVKPPVTAEVLLDYVRRCSQFNQMKTANKPIISGQISNGLLGAHPKLREITQVIAKIAPTSARVLITGESGTGKELIAMAIHNSSTRAHKSVLKLNCAAIPKNLMESELFGHEKGSFTGASKMRQGVFERADGGTLFLDEIGELNLDLQAKLLQVLQSGEFTRIGGERTISTDVRIICATNRDLKAMCHKGDFREDLYYRLKVVSIHSPPLRERVSDINLLARSFLAEFCAEHSLGSKQLASQAIKQLESYQWPGNIRELRNVIERSAILSSGTIIESIELFDQQLDPSNHEVANVSANENQALSRMTINVPLQSWDSFHQHVDREYLTFVLRRTNGNVSEAARVLDLERAYLHRLMKKLGIHRDFFDS
jgi:two-component system nitrogen regulation response regulator NtrX